MVKASDREPWQTWRMFVANHLYETAACDFFTVPTATLKVLHCFVVLSLDRRRIVHINVTDHTTAAWTARQLIEAFRRGAEPCFLMRDRDDTYGGEFVDAVKLLGITEIISAPKSPWQNPFVERMIWTIRRECTDHVLPFGRQHLLGLLREFVDYYPESRPHSSLGWNSPPPRRVGAPARKSCVQPSRSRSATTPLCARGAGATFDRNGQRATLPVGTRGPATLRPCRAPRGSGTR